MTHPFLSLPAWIFDLDGTLTIAQHDFAAIREALGLPKGRPILEALAELPEAEARPLHLQLAEIELEIAGRAEQAPGAEALLEALAERQVRLGILTRNTRENALVTLKATNLLRFFEPQAILGRDEAAPKPSPAGILLLLELWQQKAAESVMVGDFLFDLQAGRSAGTQTIYTAPSGDFTHRDWADICVHSLTELLIC